MRDSHPAVDIPESIYSKDDCQSVSSLDTSRSIIADSLTEFDFDDAIVNSKVYRQALATAHLSELRSVEQQLAASIQSHEKTHELFGLRQEETEKAYREKLEQLEADYQTAVHFLKGTEKMMKRMKNELDKYKSENIRLKQSIEERSYLNKEGVENGFT